MLNRTPFAALLGCLAVLAFVPALPAAEAPYDLLIRNGRIVDGTGNPWFIGDLAIRGDRIVAVGRVPARPARRTIDAKGLVVAPGFIDMHSHSDYVLLEDGLAQGKVRQGVTTEVLGEGRSAGPLKGKLSARWMTVRDRIVIWETLGGYFDTLNRAGISVNVASYVGLDNLWESVMGKSHARPTAEQFDQMKTLLDEAMKDGAFGLSSLLAMPPGSLATTDDLVELCKVVAKYRGIFSTHNRNEGLGVMEAIREAIAVGERAGVGVDVIHLKIADRKLWGQMDKVMALIEAARKRGVNVQANVYPYVRGNNDLSSILPPWVHEGGTARLLARLKSAKDRERMKKDIKEGLEGWYNHYTAVGGDWSRMLVSGRGRYEGLTMDRVIAVKTRGKKPAPDSLDVLFDVLLEEGGSVPTVYAHHTEKDMRLAMLQPWCSIGSDGSAYAVEGLLRRGHPHPRNFGTFPRVLGVYVRELGLLRLEDAVRKMTSLNAAKLGLMDRGILRAGMYADVTVFDAGKVIDRSTYEKPFQYSEGIEYVIVNGTLVVERGKHTRARPGRALRRENRTPAPLRVKAFRVRRFAGKDTQIKEVGAIGEKSFAARFGDLVKIETEFSEPAYAYLLAFNADGKEQLLWPANAAKRPASVERLTYPRPQQGFVLDDEPAGGWQAFALVLSRKPLPPFADWRKKRGAAAWRRMVAGMGVFGHDHAGMYRQLPNGRVLRGEKDSPAGPHLQRLVESLRKGGEVELVQVLAFPVTAKDER